MSRIGRQPVVVPSGVEVTRNGDEVQVKGPKGALSSRLPSSISMEVEEGQVVFRRPDEPTTDLSLARQRVDAVTATDRHADLLTAIEHAERSLEGQAAAEKELYIITDGHAEEWSAFAALDDKLREVAANAFQLVIDETFFAIEHVDVAGCFAVNLQHQSVLLHRFENAIEFVQVGHSGVRIGGGAGRVKFGTVNKG